MAQQTTTQGSASSQMWDPLEAFVREHIQRFIQPLLEEEITALLGRPNPRGVPRGMPPRACGMATASPGG